MSAISIVNPKAEYARAAQALAINVSAARGIGEVMKTNLGPKGTMKMLVSGAGDIKITKDGNVLLHEMQIQHPSASLIAKASTAHDDIVGDGTTSIVLLIAEIMKQAELIICEGIHPRVITDGLDFGKKEALKVLDTMKIPFDPTTELVTIESVALTSLKTKVDNKLAVLLAGICTEAVLAICNKADKENPADLHMIEMMEMQHRNELETCLVKGIVMDHGGRHPDMPKKLQNCYILTCNVSLEYEKTEVNSGFFYKSADDREKLLASEREFIEQRVKKIIDLKKEVCPAGSDKTFVVINQKGIDPLSLDMLAKEGVMGLRRAKRRNMERLALACGGMAMNSVEGLTPDCLGYAGLVYEHVLGENKFTFVEECKNPKSVTILMKGPNKHTIVQMKDAIRDGLRSVVNAIKDGCVIPGAGAYELEVYKKLSDLKPDPRYAFGVKVLADAALIIPKTLVSNAGHDAFRSILKAKQSQENDYHVGLDLYSGETCNPKQHGIFDNFSAKRQMIDASVVVATNLLLTDEIMRAGLSSLK